MRRWRPRRFVRDLSGRANADLLQLMVQQIAARLDGARTARQAALAEVSSGSARVAMVAIEHGGDEVRKRLVTTMAASLVTPFDREDMFRVSRSIDDVLDNFRDFVRELDLFDAPDKRFVPVIDAIVDGLELLQPAIDSVTGASGEVEQRLLQAKKSCNDIRRSYQQQLALVLEGEVTTAMLRRRELLRRLDVIGLRLGEAMDALADAAVKRTL